MGSPKAEMTVSKNCLTNISTIWWIHYLKMIKNSVYSNFYKLIQEIVNYFIVYIIYKRSYYVMQRNDEKIIC